jgi:hypothetical protein
MPPPSARARDRLDVRPPARRREEVEDQHERGPDMSRAFTSEETPDTGPLIRPAPRLAPGEVRYVVGPQGAPDGTVAFGPDEADARRRPD